MLERRPQAMTVERVETKASATSTWSAHNAMFSPRLVPEAVPVAT
jgi:hypothetical protein